PKLAMPQFKQYRANDGKFYFKLVDGDGDLLLQSAGFDSPKEAGALIAGIKAGSITIETLGERIERIAGVEDDAIAAAIRQLQEAG
ncbi:MAG: DUF1508 domain-containing protein, partial [Lysobacteraceae bacterium]